MTRAAVSEGLMAGRRWWRPSPIGHVDHDHVLEEIAAESGWSGRYAFLIVISAAISLLGLLMPSVAVLIGAMLLSPLMMPIIGLGFGIATLDFSEIRRTGTALLAGSVLAVLLSVLLVSISPIQTVTSEIAGRTQPTLFDLLVALLSAIAGGYALIRGRGGTVVGVAIAIALMPPLVVVGFGIATSNWTIFSGSLLLFFTNAVTIALTAAIVARVFGFGSHLSPAHTGWQLALFVGALGILSIPLGTSLKRIAFEAVAQRQVSDAVKAAFPDSARLSQIDIDHGSSPLRIRAVILTPRYQPKADQAITLALRDRLGRPVDAHVDQVPISRETAAAEAAQIARASDASDQPTENSQDKAVADLALITGASPAAIRIDHDRRLLRAPAASLPGLTMAGYRALERRANQTLDGWRAALVPPLDAPLPAVTIRQGIIDNDALDLAAWVATATGRTLSIDGGTSAQRGAVARAINDRGGLAEAGQTAGKLRLTLLADETPKDQTSPSGNLSELQQEEE